jgi:HSP20 family protein
MALPAVRSGDVVVRWDPFREFSDLHRQFDQLVQSVFAPAAGQAGQAGQAGHPRAWRPIADVTESEAGYQVSLEVPGLKRDEIAVSVEGDTLSVTGEYQQTDGGEQRHARRSGRFSYQTLLPKTVDGEKITASLADGVLQLSIPKSGAATARRIEITEA